MNENNILINKMFPDNQVIAEWDMQKQTYFIHAWAHKEWMYGKDLPKLNKYT